jgi:hypothetical protein
MLRWLTCSHVRFNRRIGGVFRPDVMAIIVEKLFRVRQRYNTVRVNNLGHFEVLTSATLIKCFIACARRRESFLLKTDSATQSAIYGFDGMRKTFIFLKKWQKNYAIAGLDDPCNIIHIFCPLRTQKAFHRLDFLVKLTF